MIDLKKLKVMSIDELEKLISIIKLEIESRKQAPLSEEFSFNFEATNDTRKGVPYVAKLGYEDGRVQRRFYEFDKQEGKRDTTVTGHYRARAGDMVEIRTGGSWKNDYRAWYLVNPIGELVLIADLDDSEGIAQAERYLKGEIAAELMMKK